MELKTYTVARSAIRAGKSAVEKCSMDLIVTAIDAEGLGFGNTAPFIVAITIDQPFAELSAEDLAHLEGFKISSTPDAQLAAEEVARAAAEEEAKSAPAPAAKEPKVGKSAYIAETSVVKGATKMVWAIADSLCDAEKGDAPRKEVIAACREAGIAFGTARTQYQKWKAARGE